MNHGTRMMWKKRLPSAGQAMIGTAIVCVLGALYFTPNPGDPASASKIRYMLIESDISIRACMTGAIKKKSESHDPVITNNFIRRQKSVCEEEIENRAHAVQQKDAIALAIEEQERQVSTPGQFDAGDMSPDEVIKWLSKNSPAINVCAMDKVKKHYDTKDYAVRRQDMRSMISACSSALSKQAQIEAINKLEKK